MAVSYLFVLGRDKKLGILELEQYFSSDALQVVERRFVLVDPSQAFSIDDFGGTTKIFRAIDSLDELVFEKNKLTYSVHGPEKLTQQLKKRFKEEKIKASFRPFTPDPSSCDVELIYLHKRLFSLHAMSKPKLYKLRDENRPRFDAKQVLSIRVAKIMLNLSQARQEVLDPFCGSGTVLQEAMLKGLNVTGLDMNVRDTQRNLGWLKKTYSLNTKFTLIQGNARNLDRYVDKVECVVTEPYMGPYFTRVPLQKEALKVAKQLTSLYKDFLQACEKIVQHRIVMMVPSIQGSQGLVTLDFASLLEGTSFSLIRSQFVELPLPYSVPSAKVKREIWVLERLK